MTDYFTLAADIVRTQHRPAETRGLLMAEPKRQANPNTHRIKVLDLSDDDFEVLTEALRIAKTAISDELLRSRFISDSHREYLNRWIEKFDDMRLRIEER